jgi:hypothetical protein
MPPKPYIDGAIHFMKSVDITRLDPMSTRKLSECLDLLLIGAKFCEKQGVAGSKDVKTELQRLIINYERRDFDYGHFFKTIERMFAGAGKQLAREV